MWTTWRAGEEFENASRQITALKDQVDDIARKLSTKRFINKLVVMAMAASLDQCSKNCLHLSRAAGQIAADYIQSEMKICGA